MADHSSAGSSLPSNPSLQHLRREARVRQRDQDLTLSEAQFAVARSYGFSGWPALRHYLDQVAELGVDPTAVTSAAPADAFCELACLTWSPLDHPDRWAAAADRWTPELAADSIWAAAAAADVDQLRRHLGDRPRSSRARGGPFGWTPLLQLTYSRLPGLTVDRVLAAASAILDAGADPDAGFLWQGLATPFTVLTGVLGEGEQGNRRQPRQVGAIDLTELLLARGAHPVDHQGLYNRMFRADDSHLEQLFAHGLTDAPPGPWERRLGEAMESRSAMWRRQVDWAASHGFADRLVLLARHGIDTTAAVLQVDPVVPTDPDARDQEGATALHRAAWAGDLARIEALLAAGADPCPVEPRFDATPLDWAVHACQTEAADLLRQVQASPR